MNLWSTRIGLGIVIYLSFSILNSDRSWASSLRFSDRYELTRLSNESLLSEESLFIPYSGTQPESTSPNSSAEDTQQQLESNRFSYSYTEKPLESSSSEELRELFSAQTFNIQVETAVAETEETAAETGNLWDSIAESLTNLQFNSDSNNSFANPNIIVLPQVAYEDIYRGLYDFEINLAAIATITPRVANSPIPDIALTSQESISNYNPEFLASQALTNAPENYLSLEGYTDEISGLVANNSSENNLSADRLPGTSATDGSYEDLSTRIQSVLAVNVNPFSNVEEIELQTQNKAPNALDEYAKIRDPKQQELDEELAKEEEKLDKERRQLLQRLQNEQTQRNKKRQHEIERRAKEREQNRRKQTAKQEQVIRARESFFDRN
jgi:hypothetical protein